MMAFDPHSNFIWTEAWDYISSFFSAQTKCANAFELYRSLLRSRDSNDEIRALLNRHTVEERFRFLTDRESAFSGSPLLHLAMNGSLCTASYPILLDSLAGFSIDQRWEVLRQTDFQGHTLLMRAMSPRGSVEMVEAILASIEDFSIEQKLAILNQTTPSGETALLVFAKSGGPFVAIYSNSMPYTLRSQTEMLQVFLAGLQDCSSEQKQAVLNHADEQGCTAISYAAKESEHEIVAFLQSAAPPINHAYNTHQSAKRSHDEMAADEALVEASEKRPGNQ